MSVECYSGARYAEWPVALTWKGKRFAVQTIERRWREPDGPAFRVRATNGLRFELHYDESADQWQARASDV